MHTGLPLVPPRRARALGARPGRLHLADHRAGSPRGYAASSPRDAGSSVSFSSLQSLSHALGVRRAEASRGGWIFTAASPDPVVGARDLREVYDALTGGFRGRCTAPLLVDKKQKKLVSNESADLMRMLNEIQVAGAGSSIDLCPQVGVAVMAIMIRWSESGDFHQCGVAVFSQIFPTRLRIPLKMHPGFYIAYSASMAAGEGGRWSEMVTLVRAWQYCEGMCARASRSCGRRSTRSTTGCTTMSTTACTNAASRRRRS